MKKRFKERVCNGEDDSGQLCLLESSSARAVAPCANGHRQSPGNAVHLGAPKSFGFTEKKKKKDQQLFIEVFLAMEGVEILQILQKSEDVLYWSGDHL